MAAVVQMETGRAGYVSLLAAVQRFGEVRSPRGIKTYDVGHVIVSIVSPYDALPIGVGRSISTVIAAGEATQLIAGRADHTLLPRISENFKRYAESDGRFHGAYGDRIGVQVGHAVKKLRDDRDTRQAVVTLWDPTLDNKRGKRDYPCTVALNFSIVRDQLQLRTLMRSNDVWLGFPYDIFQFTQLQLTVARAIGVEPGEYTHETWSLHLYAHDVEQVEAIVNMPQPGIGPYQPTGFGRPGDSWGLCRERAAYILLHAPQTFSELTESESWYVQQLRAYVSDPSTELG